MGGAAATDNDIKVDFDAGTAAAAGVTGASYKPLTKLDATEASLKAEHDVPLTRATQDAKS